MPGTVKPPPIGSPKDLAERRRIIGKLYSLYPSGIKGNINASMQAFLEETMEVPTIWLSVALGELTSEKGREFIPKVGDVKYRAAKAVRAAHRRACGKNPDEVNPHTEEDTINVSYMLKVSRHHMTPLLGPKNRKIYAPNPAKDTPQLTAWAESMHNQTTESQRRIYEEEDIEVNWDAIADKMEGNLVE